MNNGNLEQELQKAKLKNMALLEKINAQENEIADLRVALTLMNAATESTQETDEV